MTQASAFHFESLVWDWPIAIYLFLIGISAGLVTLAVLLRRFYPQAGGADSTLLRTTLIVGPGAVILGLLILVFHLTRPWTFWKLMFHYSFTSVMSMGVMLFQLYMVVLVLWLAKIFEHDLLALQQRWLPKLGFVQKVLSLLTPVHRGLETLMLVLAVSFSSQMQACIVVDREGKALRPAMIWADHRAEKQAEYLEEKIGFDRMYEINGHRVSPSYSIEKLMWIKEHEPEIYGKAYKMLLAKDYIICRLTGAFVTDYSDASGTQALDLRKLEWSDEILKAADIDKDKLPELKKSTDVAGYIRERVAGEIGLPAGTPVVCGGGDGPVSGVLGHLPRLFPQREGRCRSGVDRPGRGGIPAAGVGVGDHQAVCGQRALLPGHRRLQ